MTLGGAAATATHAYGEASYWDQRYRQDAGPFDWYQKYGPLAPLLDLYLRRRHRALLVGCGNSALGEEMVNDGYEDIVNIDISSVVIEAMQKKFQDHPEMKYITMDVRDMSVFESGSFDAVIDKGTLDSLMCGHNAQENATKMLEEVDRILKDKGLYILITYGDPKYRLYLLKSVCCWNVNLHVIAFQQITFFNLHWKSFWLKGEIVNHHDNFYHSHNQRQLDRMGLQIVWGALPGGISPLTPVFNGKVGAHFICTIVMRDKYLLNQVDALMDLRIVEDRFVSCLIKRVDSSCRVVKSEVPWRFFYRRDAFQLDYPYIVDLADRPDKVPEDQTWDLIKPIPLNEDGSLATSVLGSKLEIHYIYVCTKDESLRSSVNEMTGGHV